MWCLTGAAEWEARVDLAAAYRLLQRMNVVDAINNHLTVRGSIPKPFLLAVFYTTKFGGVQEHTTTLAFEHPKYRSISCTTLACSGRVSWQAAIGVRSVTFQAQVKLNTHPYLCLND
jgi:hypothetical protein